MNIVIFFMMLMLALFLLMVLITVKKIYQQFEKVLKNNFKSLLAKATLDKEIENKIASLIYLVEKAGESISAGAIVSFVLETNIETWKIIALLLVSYYIKELGRNARNKFYSKLSLEKAKVIKTTTLKDAKRLLSNQVKG